MTFTCRASHARSGTGQPGSLLLRRVHECQFVKARPLPRKPNVELRYTRPDGGVR